MGPLVKTIMTRCIHCTRCVRFATEVAGVPELGMLGRGEHAEITTYLEKAVIPSFSGNVIDLCPVGALTSKPYAFGAALGVEQRPNPSTCWMRLAAISGSISVETEVLRVLPRLQRGRQRGMDGRQDALCL